MKQRKLRKKERKEITQNARKFPRKLRIVESLNQDFSPLALLTFGSNNSLLWRTVLYLIGYLAGLWSISI